MPLFKIKNIVDRIRSLEFGFSEILLHYRNYLFGAGSIAIIKFISIPVYTTYLTPDQFGYFSLLESYSQLLIITMTLNLHASIGRFSYDERADYKIFYGSVIVGCSVILFICSTSFLYFEKEIGKYLKLPVGLIRFIPLIVFFGVVQSFFVQTLQPQKKSGIISIALLILHLLTFIFSFFLLVLVQWDNAPYYALAFGQVFAFFIASIFFIYSIRESIVFRFRIQLFREAVFYSFPLLFYTLSGTVINQIDRVMINHYQGPFETGLYSAASDLGMFMGTFQALINSAWYPFYFEYMKNADYISHDRDVRFNFAIIAFSATAFIFFSKEFFSLLTHSNYHVAHTVIPIVILSYVFHFLFYVYGGRNIDYLKKTIYLSVIVFIAALINIILNFLWIPSFGYVAAAYSTLISYILMMVMAYIVNRFLLKLHSPSFAFFGTALLVLAFDIFIYNFLFLEAIEYDNLLPRFFLLILSGLLYFKDTVVSLCRRFNFS
ncbi:oligosaccharide flippase family protein [Leptospira sp. FAT2]|uniref:oligosaccharide flippase family protein n=1 Tax=Leptospira sanjuanensis TaxID=2879643 RepID=UPI001EE8DD91|nr:oligosaccharide flippase family protein [Leptospira sanjuanensis]MCG6167610.1 oligosaccharide flippase family protein [Leptospira sanjuanensis]MCG6193029.1 oligosaccharide flippase family protein [Leptospira sanjuanensis]